MPIFGSALRLRKQSTPDTVPSNEVAVYAKSDGLLYRKVGTTETLLVPASTGLVGEIKMWPTTTAPESHLMCSGGTFSSVTYPELATILGDTYGTHSGTTYHLPDFRGRSPLGAGTASPAVPGGTAHTLGQKGGEEKHSQTAAEMASHYHDFPDVGWTNSFADSPAAGLYAFPMSTIYGTQHGGGAIYSYTSAKGSGTPANVLSPYLGINFIIRAA